MKLFIIYFVYLFCEVAVSAGSVAVEIVDSMDDNEGSGDGDLHLMNKQTGCSPRCINGVCDSFSRLCVCDSGYSGPSCAQRSAIPVQGGYCEKYSNPCRHGGACLSQGYQNNGYICVCVGNYEGRHCGRLSKSICEPNPCNGQNCLPLGDSYTCTSPCSPNPCSSGQTCSVIGSSYTCTSPCLPNPCPGSQICSVVGSSYTCVSLCLPNTCPAGQTCSVIGSSYTCTSPCSPNPCLGGQTCSVVGKSYTCFQHDPCFPNPCSFGQTCNRNGVNRQSYTCISTNLCSPNPCHNGQSCRPNGQSYQCIQTDPCSNSPCPIGTRCVATGLSYDCVGIQKITCATMANRCQNGCACQESCRHEDGFFCIGSNGYLGKLCDIPPPTVICEPTRMTISVANLLITRYGVMGTSILIIAGQNTVASGSYNDACVLRQIGGGSYSISLDVNTRMCDMVKTSSGDGMLQYQANLWMKMPGNARSFDVPVPLLKINCKYNLEYTLVTSIQPFVEKPRMLYVEGKQTVSGVIELCKVGNSCPNTCPISYKVTDSAIYTVGEKLHLNIRTSNQRFSSFVRQDTNALDRLYLSCLSTPNSSPVVSLVSNGCPDSSAFNYMPTTIDHNGQSTSVCASFQVPKIANCNEVYIHAKLSSCNGRSTTICHDSKTQRCLSRRKRSSNATSENEEKVFGPLFFVTLPKGRSSSVIFPNKELVPVDAFIPSMKDPDSDTDVYLKASAVPSAFVVASCVLLLLFVFAIFALYRAYFYYGKM